jgi:lysophospholipase L1-like esterase
VRWWRSVPRRWRRTITQNVSWTIDRAGTTTKYRVTAYGDSIYAGYRGSLSSVAKRAAPWVDGEYLSQAWNSDIEVIRRAKSGAVASDIYNSKIVNERSYMQATNTRIVTFEMCGNDGLQARSSFSGQSGTCSLAPLDTALSNCSTYLANAMNYINNNAYGGVTLKVVSNLYYPGYAADNTLTNCTIGGVRQNKQSIFLPYIAKINWRACNFANTYGFTCADSFAQYMGADYDSNGDGQIDSDALRYVQGESEAAYVTRITTTLRVDAPRREHPLRDAGTSYDYIQSDDTHPTYTGSTVGVGFFGGTGSGTSAPGLHRRADRRRQEPGLESARPRAHGLGAHRQQSSDAVSALDRLRAPPCSCTRRRVLATSRAAPPLRVGSLQRREAALVYSAADDGPRAIARTDRTTMESASCARRVDADCTWVIAAPIRRPIVVTLGGVAVIRRRRRAPSRERRRAARGGACRAAALEPHPTASPSHTPARVTAAASSPRPSRDVPSGSAPPGAAPRETAPRDRCGRRDHRAPRGRRARRHRRFGLPGSHPPKSGILVPEGFELPEGYVPHYQSTDDGEQLPAILMFHPDYEFRNDAGESSRCRGSRRPPRDGAAGSRDRQGARGSERKARRAVPLSGRDRSVRAPRALLGDAAAP